MGSYTLAEIASRVGGTVRGDGSRRVAGLQPLETAGPEDLSFVAHPRYRHAAAASRAAGLIASDGDVAPGLNLIVVPNPYAALAAVMDLFFALPRPAPGLSPLAAIGQGVQLGKDVSIGPYAVVGDRSRVGERAALMAGVILGEDVTVGADSVLHPGVVVYAHTVIGERVMVHAGSVLGSDGFGYAEVGGGRAKIAQVGNVVVGDDVEIGACVTVDRATFGSTVIGRGAKIDNLVQVAHNVVVGEDAVLVAQSGIAGSTRLGRGAILAGQAGVAGHLVLGDGARVGAKSAALQDVGPGAFVLGIPAVDHREWKQTRAALRRLPELLHRVARLEAALRLAPGGTSASEVSARVGRRRTSAARKADPNRKPRVRR